MQKFAIKVYSCRLPEVVGLVMPKPYSRPRKGRQGRGEKEVGNGMGK